VWSKYTKNAFVAKALPRIPLEAEFDEKGKVGRKHHPPLKYFSGYMALFTTTFPSQALAHIQFQCHSVAATTS